MVFWHPKKKSAQPAQVGISFTCARSMLAVMMPSGQIPTLHALTSFIWDETDTQKSDLAKVVKGLQLHQNNTVIVLPTEAYQIFLMEQPKVPVSEKKAALIWQIADYIDFPVEEALIDYIELPPKVVEGAAMMYVVVAKKSYVEKIVNLVNDAGLKVKAIDVCQSVLKQLAFAMAENEIGQALLYLSTPKSHLLLYKDKTLYMIRDLEMAVENFHSPENYLQLSLEIQRSLDYCASHFKNVTISQILIAPFDVKNEELVSTLSDTLGLMIKEFSFSQIINNSEKFLQDNGSAATLAISAALSP